ncbi:hypothetical protein OHB49_35955 [Streptomyces sp. NBC_01717]|nr:hypothetical protein [Streptomyces sp. NBC_01717]
MSDPTVNFLAAFAGAGRALFSKLDDALERPPLLARSAPRRPEKRGLPRL